MPASTGGDWRAHVLGALDELGPSTAAEIAHEIDAKPETVNSHLRTLASEKQVHVSGRAPSIPGKSGPPPNLWARGNAADTNGAEPPPAPPAQEPGSSGESRLRTLSLRLAEQRQLADAMTEERDRAREQKRASDQERREAVHRAEQAEARLASVQRRVEVLEAAAAGPSAEMERLEEEVEQARSEAAAATDTLATAVTERDGLRGEVDRLTEALDDARAELAARPRVTEDGREAPAAPLVLTDLDEGDTRRIEYEHRVKMRERYFDLLLAAAGHENADPDIFDRIERLFGSHHDDIPDV